MYVMIALEFWPRIKCGLFRDVKHEAVSHGYVKQGLTGLLQSPVRGAERAGLRGMISGNYLNFFGLDEPLRFTELKRPRYPEITDVTMYINMPSDIYPTHFAWIWFWYNE
jgi:hypothetical protein